MSEIKQDQTRDEPWTVLRLLEWTTNFFKQRGSESARLDAEILLAHARECERIELYTAFAEVPSEEERVAFREMVHRRGEGMPVAQLVGYREFYSLRFRVNENVLIPRPETEHLVVEALDIIKHLGISDRPIQLADVGTGSGAIGIAIAHQAKNVEVTAIDESKDALRIAKWNVENLKVADRVKLVQSDLFTAVKEPRTFDLICSNPPYVSESEYEQLPLSVRDFEPMSALVAGIDGMDVIKRLLEEAPARLADGGQMIVEISPMIAQRCCELIEETDDFGEPKLIKDLADHNRVFSVQKVRP